MLNFEDDIPAARGATVQPSEPEIVSLARPWGFLLRQDVRQCLPVPIGTISASIAASSRA